MKLIVCLDERCGMEFNKRRQSRDSVLIKDILALTADSELYISEYSKLLFEEDTHAAVIDSPELLKEGSSPSPYYFMEKKLSELPSYPIDEVVIYRWNRHYPSDVYFDLDMSPFKLIETKEFVGSSHKKITREVYKKK
jgi:hypothetical protein